MIGNEESIIVLGPHDNKPKNAYIINTTSRSDSWSYGLSPFVLGPTKLWDGRISQNVENAWQYSKVYDGYMESNKPSKEWYCWSDKGFQNLKAKRFPMGKGAKPLGAWFQDRLIGYIESRKKLYFPFYRNAVRKTKSWKILKGIYSGKLFSSQILYLYDFDGYNKGSKTLFEVLNDPNKIMGHAFVLAIMLIYGEDIIVENL